MQKPPWLLVAAITTVNGTIAFIHPHNDVETRRVSYPASARQIAVPHSATFSNSLGLVYSVNGQRWP